MVERIYEFESKFERDFAMAVAVMSGIEQDCLDSSDSGKFGYFLIVMGDWHSWRKIAKFEKYLEKEMIKLNKKR